MIERNVHPADVRMNNLRSVLDSQETWVLRAPGSGDSTDGRGCFQRTRMIPSQMERTSTAKASLGRDARGPAARHWDTDGAQKTAGAYSTATERHRDRAAAERVGGAAELGRATDRLPARGQADSLMVLCIWAIQGIKPSRWTEQHCVSTIREDTFF